MKRWLLITLISVMLTGCAAKRPHKYVADPVSYPVVKPSCNLEQTCQFLMETS